MVGIDYRVDVAGGQSGLYVRHVHSINLAGESFPITLNQTDSAVQRGATIGLDSPPRRAFMLWIGTCRRGQVYVFDDPHRRHRYWCRKIPVLYRRSITGNHGKY
ncbi:hypothetical protein [Massilia cavernae]|uniref:hypothetical protein n=1 Tax=Massilia cavernae TaxID=2320864 RepID=UPI0011C407A6|nr:hypothetical protein [Massilia cavernae]